MSPFSWLYCNDCRWSISTASPTRLQWRVEVILEAGRGPLSCSLLAHEVPEHIPPRPPIDNHLATLPRKRLRIVNDQIDDPSFKGSKRYLFALLKVVHWRHPPLSFGEGELRKGGAFPYLGPLFAESADAHCQKSTVDDRVGGLVDLLLVRMGGQGRFPSGM